MAAPRGPRLEPGANRTAPRRAVAGAKKDRSLELRGLDRTGDRHPRRAMAKDPGTALKFAICDFGFWERSAAVSKTSRSAWEVRRGRELAACCGWSRTTQPRSVSGSLEPSSQGCSRT